MDEDRDEFAKAKLALARNLAGENKVVVLSLLDHLLPEHERLIRLADMSGITVLSLLDCPRPGLSVLAEGGWSGVGILPKPHRGIPPSVPAALLRDLTAALLEGCYRTKRPLR
jgi:hypothetical protein